MAQKRHARLEQGEPRVRSRPAAERPAASLADAGGNLVVLIAIDGITLYGYHELRHEALERARARAAAAGAGDGQLVLRLHCTVATVQGLQGETVDVALEDRMGHRYLPVDPGTVSAQVTAGLRLPGGPFIPVASSRVHVLRELPTPLWRASVRTGRQGPAPFSAAAAEGRGDSACPGEAA